jgi:hypothetical protein
VLRRGVAFTVEESCGLFSCSFDTKWVEYGVISGNTALSKLKYELGKKGVTDGWSSTTVNVTSPMYLPETQFF